MTTYLQLHTTHYTLRFLGAVLAHTQPAKMYNSLTRLQNVFGFFTTVAFVVGAIIAASDFAIPRTPNAVIKPTNVQV